MSTASTCQAIRICINAVAARMFDASDDLCTEVMASCQAAGGGGGIVSGLDEHGRAFATMTLDELTGGGGGRADADGADTSGYTTSPGAACARTSRSTRATCRCSTSSAVSWPTAAGRATIAAASARGTSCAPHHAGSRVQVLSFGQGLQHPAAIGVAGGEPGGSSGFALLPPRTSSPSSAT